LSKLKTLTVEEMQLQVSQLDLLDHRRDAENFRSRRAARSRWSAQELPEELSPDALHSWGHGYRRPLLEKKTF
jgi:hypothetical protein